MDAGVPVRQTSRDIVMDGLRQQILAGDLRPGTRLIVPDLTARFGVSLTPIREALQGLESSGLVVLDAFKGARVAELDADDCEEIYAMRTALEVLAAEKSTTALDEAGIQEMHAHVREMGDAAAANDMDGFLHADRAFHRVHYLASGRTRLWERILNLRLSAERYTRLTYRAVPTEMSHVADQHTHGLDVISSGDIDATTAWVRETLASAPKKARDLLSRLTY
jgi:DNA-binding GntR family transcriptional regulator